jgi:hypothetical protein
VRESPGSEVLDDLESKFADVDANRSLAEASRLRPEAVGYSNVCCSQPFIEIFRSV